MHHALGRFGIDHAYREVLNQLVKKHISSVVARSPPRALSTLEQEVTALLATGMITLNVKLSELDDEKLLPRVSEVWEFFWHQVLPYVEGVCDLSS